MTVERADGLAWREIDGETFVVDLRRKWMYGLNGPAGVLWQAVVDGAAVDDMVRDYLRGRSRPIPHEQAERLVLGFLRRLADAGLVTFERDGNPSTDGTAAETEDCEAPAVVWSEELRAFGQSCAPQPLACPPPPSG